MPKVKLSIDSSVAPTTSNFNSSSAAQLKDSSILDGSEVHFKCDTEANPNDVRIKWFINDILVVGDYTNEMVNLCVFLSIFLFRIILEFYFCYFRVCYFIRWSFSRSIRNLNDSKFVNYIFECFE